MNKFESALASIITVLLMFIAATIGAYCYNQPIDSIKWKIISSMCNKNDGLKTVRRSWSTADKFIVKCNDTATFEDVSFNLTIQQGQS